MVREMESITVKLSCKGDCYLGYKDMSPKCASQCENCKLKRMPNRR